MRLKAIIIPLCLTPLSTIASPIPLVLIEDLEAVSKGNHNSLATMTYLAPKRPEHTSSKVIIAGGAPKDHFDNRPLVAPTTGAGAEPPSGMLTSPRPLSTSYLLSITGGRRKGEGGRFSQLPVQAIEAVESSSITQMEMGVEVATTIEMPCYYYTLLAREHNDVLAVSLVFVFAMVVVVVETWASLLNSARRVFSKEGAVQLQGQTPTYQEVSIQADATDLLAWQDEKDAL